MELTEKEKKARSMVCLPLDGLKTIDDVKDRIEELHKYVGIFKIGKELFTRFGPKSIELVHEFGSEVFLDLKYHDIPNTVEAASAAATELGVYMFNVHASGGVSMMEAAISGAKLVSDAGFRMPKIIAVTVLTSIDKDMMNNQVGVFGEVHDSVLRLGLLAKKVGLDGIVCSAADLDTVKEKLGDDFMYITPGIKAVDNHVGKDQVRVFGPAEAVESGSSILVIGRAIRARPTPEERQNAAYEILKAMAEKL